MPVRIKNDKNTVGFLNIILEILKESNAPLSGKSFEDRAEIQQWIEYVLIYVANTENGYAVSNVLRVSNSKTSRKKKLNDCF